MSPFSPITERVGSPWQTVESYLEECGMEKLKIPGDGLCMVNSIVAGLNNDYGTMDTTYSVMQAIFEEIQWKSSLYASFHTGDPDQVVADTKAYFEDRKYTSSVVDVCLPAAAEALKVSYTLRSKLYVAMFIDR